MAVVSNITVFDYDGFFTARFVKQPVTEETGFSIFVGELRKRKARCVQKSHETFFS